MHAKGLRTERKAIKNLKNSGFVVERVIHTRWSRKDFFGLFDLIAKNSKLTRWIQVKTSKSPSQTKRDIEEFKSKYGNPYETYEIWVWKDRKFKIIIV